MFFNKYACYLSKPIWCYRGKILKHSTCVSKLSRDYFDFFQEWFTNFHNPITIVCFEEMVQDPVNEVRRMLNFLEFPDYRKSQNVDCVILKISNV